MDKEVIKVNNLGMRFNLMEKKVDNFKEYAIKFLKREIRYQEFWALKDISFSVNQGERLGILGLNGAGKSTLLKIIAGVLKPSEGNLTIKGKIVPLLELGAGFDPQYTGAENIYLYGAVLGYPKEFISEKYTDIVEFSELQDFINVPVKNYSSGMKARLGFSIATVMDPNILILDEVLSVGDAKFKKKSEKRILDLFDKGVTVLFVSHSVEQVKRICNRAIILDKGKLVADGTADEICGLYNEKYIGEEKAKAKPKKKKKKKPKAPVQEEKQAIDMKSEKTNDGSDGAVPMVSIEASKELGIQVSGDLIDEKSVQLVQEEIDAEKTVLPSEEVLDGEKTVLSSQEELNAEKTVLSSQEVLDADKTVL